MKCIVCLFFFAYCIFCASCGHVAQNNYLIIDLYNHLQLPLEETPVSEVSTSIQIIPLETSDSVLIGTVKNIKLETNKLFILARNGLFVFDNNGKFLNTVSSKGRGPKEYIALSDIYIDKDIVWLLDDSGNKALKYTNSGKFLSSFNFEQPLWSDFGYYGNDTFIGFLPDYGLPETNVMLAFFNTTGIVDSILYKTPIPKNVSAFTSYLYYEAAFVYCANQIKFKHIFNDTIYKIDNFKLVPEIVLDLGLGKANENARREAVYNDVSYNLFHGMDVTRLRGESERYVYLNVGGILIFYDKTEQKVHKWKFILPVDARLDLEESKKFVPMYIDQNGYLIGETVGANPEDNPVIIIAKLKQ